MVNHSSPQHLQLGPWPLCKAVSPHLPPPCPHSQDGPTEPDLRAVMWPFAVEALLGVIRSFPLSYEEGIE